MNDTKLLPDDPRLTAYALGELSGDERAAVEAALRQNPALRSIVEDVRATAQQLEAALAAEPALEVEALLEYPKPAKHLNGHAVLTPKDPDLAAAAILPGNDPTKFDGGDYRSPDSRGKLLRFPQLYVVIGGLAAACFAVLVALNRDAYTTKQQARETAERIALQQWKIAEAKKAQRSTVELTLPVASPVDAAERTGIFVTDAHEPAVMLPGAENSGEASDSAQLAAGSSSPRSSFIDGGLTLVEQSRHDPGALGQRFDERAPGSSLIAGNNYTLSNDVGGAAGPDRSIDARGVEKTIGTSNTAAPVESVVTVASNPPAPRGAADRAAPTTSASPAPTSRPGGRAGAGMVAGTGPASFPPGTTDEIVLLDTFTVTADHVVDLSALSYFDRTKVLSRGLVERKELPRPPLGAQFVRNSAASTSAKDNEFHRVADRPQSTFSVAVDTANYAVVRRMIEEGAMPPRDAVRIEEMLNYFPYGYPAPAAERGETQPFAASLEVADAPWAPTHRLVRIGLKGREGSLADRVAANLVFLLDVSASMGDANKLPLFKESMRHLVDRLRPDDRIAIVVYAGTSGIALPSTPVSNSPQIFAALDALRPGVTPSGATGIRAAYEIAKNNFAPGGFNRVILCTDGDFDVGTAGEGELGRLIEEKATSGVFLTLLGFGMGSARDTTLERLASKGNGNYGYIDTRREAEKLFVDQVSSALVTIAKDVRIQVDFNQAKVSSYRLIGYENRLLRKEDFNNDKVDSGEVGAGHTLTALYEIVPIGAEETVASARAADDLKYQAKGAVSSRLEMPSGRSDLPGNQMLAVNVRYKKPGGFMSHTQEFKVIDAGTRFANASPDFRFAAAVAQFGMILRDSPHKGAGTLGDVLAWAANAASPASDPRAHRREFIDLVRKTQRLLR